MYNVSSTNHTTLGSTSRIDYKLEEAMYTNISTMTLEENLQKQGYYGILATRLDYATSGMVLVATSTSQHTRIRALESDGHITKYGV